MTSTLRVSLLGLVPGLVLLVGGECAVANDCNSQQETVRFVEQFLFEREFEPGKVDGFITHETVQAIRLYQSLSEDLPDSGRIDRPLMEHIGRATGRCLSYSLSISNEHKGISSRELIRDVQIHLKQIGYYGGRIDGIAGPLTSFAISLYLADQSATRQLGIDRELIEMLRNTKDLPREINDEKQINLNRDIQTNLIELNHYDGPIDGRYTYNLRRAIVDFLQETRIVRPTHTDPALLALMVKKRQEVYRQDGFASVLGDLLVSLPDLSDIASQIEYNNYDVSVDIDSAVSTLAYAQTKISKHGNELTDLSNDMEIICKIVKEDATNFVMELQIYQESVAKSMLNVQDKIQTVVDASLKKIEDTNNDRAMKLLTKRVDLLSGHAKQVSKIEANLTTGVQQLERLAIDVKEIREFVCQE